MENQHKKIKGYRELNQAEIDLMNEIKEAGEKLLSLHESLVARLNTDAEVKTAAAEKSKLAPNDYGSDECAELSRFTKAEPHRWAAIGKTNIQQGVMAMVRAVAQSTNY